MQRVVYVSREPEDPLAVSLFDFGITRTSRKRHDETSSSELPSGNAQAIDLPAKKPRAFQDAWLKRYPWYVTMARLGIATLP